MNKTSSNLLFLAIGAAVGFAAGYLIATDKKEKWLNEANKLVDRVRTNVKGAVTKGKNKLEDEIEDLCDNVE